MDYYAGFACYGESGVIVQVKAKDAYTAEKLGAQLFDLGDGVESVVLAATGGANVGTSTPPAQKPTGTNNAQLVADQAKALLSSVSGTLKRNDQKLQEKEAELAALLNQNVNNPEGQEIAKQAQEGLNLIRAEIARRAAAAAAKPVSTFDQEVQKLSNRLGSLVSISNDPNIRVGALPNQIIINPEVLKAEAAANGLNDAQAVQWINKVADEEVRHLAQHRAARDLYNQSGDTRPFEVWRDEHYKMVWQTQFVATGKDAMVRKLYGDGLDSLPEWKRAMEGIRIMWQRQEKGSPTEIAKLWTNISAAMIEELKAVLRQLRAMVKNLSPEMKSELALLQSKLKEIETEQSQKKPAQPPATSTPPKTETPKAAFEVGQEVTGKVTSANDNENGQIMSGKVFQVGEKFILVNVPSRPTPVRMAVGDVTLAKKKSDETPKAVALIDGTLPNENGVYPIDLAEAIAHKTKKAEAYIHVAQLSNGKWIATSSYEHNQGSYIGMGSPLTARTVFDSRAQAILSYATNLANEQSGLIKGGMSAPEVAEAQKIIDWANGLIAALDPNAKKPAPKKPAPKKKSRVGRALPRHVELFLDSRIGKALYNAGGIMSKTAALKKYGAEYMAENGSNWEDKPEFKNPVFNKYIFGGEFSNRPDQAASALFREGVIKEDSSKELWAEIGRALQSARSVAEQEKVENERLKQAEDFARVKDDGPYRVNVDEMSTGDKLVIDGENFTVATITRKNNEVTKVVLEDGARFGRQTLESGEDVWVEEFDDGAPKLTQEESEELDAIQKAAEAAAAAAAAPKPPASKMDIAQDNAKELFADDGGFALVQENTQDGDKVAKAKADAEAAKEAADKAQGKLFSLTEDDQLIADEFEGLFAAPLSTNPFYSQLAKAIGQKMPKSASVEQVLAIARDNAKAEEVKWSGIAQAAQEMAVDGKVSRDALLAYLANEGTVKFEEWSSDVKFRTFDAEEAARLFAQDKSLVGFWNDGSESMVENAEEIGNHMYYALDDDLEGTAESIPSKFSQYTIPGGKNYREVVLAMPNVSERQKVEVEVDRFLSRIRARLGKPSFEYEDMTDLENKEFNQFQARLGSAKVDSAPDYTSRHFPNVPNYVAHIRTTERTDVDGNAGLFIEEIQSDRHQEGRKKGYRGDFLDKLPDNWKTVQTPSGFWVVENEQGVRVSIQSPNKEEAIQDALKAPTNGLIADAPFRTTWPLAMFKRALRDAVASGKSWIGWTTGDTQNDRFDLSKQVDAVKWGKSTFDETYDISYVKDGRTHSAKYNVTPEELPNIVGKEVAQKIISASQTEFKGELSGLDLKVGGSGMKGFYDNMLPKEIGKYVKQWGGNVKKASIGQSITTDDLDMGDMDEATPQELAMLRANGEVQGDAVPIWRIDITPEMRKSVNEGQMLFAAPLTPSYSENIPADRLGGMVSLASKLIGKGVNTPEAIAGSFSRIEEAQNKPGALRKYSEALWSAFRMVDTTLPKDVDWGKVYQSLEKPDKKQPKEATGNELSLQYIQMMMVNVLGNKTLPKSIEQYIYNEIAQIAATLPDQAKQLVVKLGGQLSVLPEELAGLDDAAEIISEFLKSDRTYSGINGSVGSWDLDLDWKIRSGAFGPNGAGLYVVNRENDNDDEYNSHVDADILESAADGNTDSFEYIAKIIADEIELVESTKKEESEEKETPFDKKQAEEQRELEIVLKAREIAQGSGTEQEKYNLLVELYESMPALNTKTSTSKINQAFSTPVPLSYAAALMSGPVTGSVYDSAAGHASLLVDVNENSNAIVNELDPKRLARLRQISPRWTVTNEDATTQVLPNKVDQVRINPPFGSITLNDGSKKIFQTPMGETTQIDHAIVLQTLGNMKDDGRAVLIIGGPPPIAQSEKGRRDFYSKGNAAKFFAYLHENYNVIDHATVNGDLYKKQGAGWPVDIIVIDGKKKSSTSLPSVKVPVMLNTWAEVFQHSQLNDNDRITNRTITDEEVRANLRDAAAELEKLRGRGNSGGNGGPPAIPDGRPDGDKKPSGNVPDGNNETPSQQDQQQGEGQGSTQSGNDGAGKGDGNAGQSGNNNQPKSRNDGKTPAVTKFQQEYIPFSGGFSLGTLVPTNMADAIAQAFARIKADVGDLTAFVENRLGYKPNENIEKHFAGEQIDALAAAIWNFERGGALIVGDQTGIGKGRIAAGLMRYAINQGMTPVFVTEKRGLLDTMLRGDLVDIDAQDIVKPACCMSNLTDFDEGKRQKLPHGQKYFDRVASTGELGDGANAIFTLYSQIQGDTSKNADKKARERAKRDGNAPEGAWRTSALKRIAPNAVFILDESHNAAGASITGYRLAEIMQGSKRVYYSSATSIKRPENMGIYFKTNIGKVTNGSMDSLVDIMQSGGVPAMQLASYMLAMDGQLLRRERSFEGISFETKINNKSKERDEALADNLTYALRQIVTVQDTMQQVATIINDRIAGIAKSAKIPAGSRDKLETGNFSSKVHNVVSQYLLAIKCSSAVDEAMRAIGSGKKVVVGLSNTMESAITDLMQFSADPDTEFSMTYKGLVMRYLDKMRTIKTGFGEEDIVITETPNPKFASVKTDQLFMMATIRQGSGDTGSVSINQEVVSELVRRYMWEAYENARNEVRKIDLGDMPLSPIDYMRQAMEERGVRTGEITGRSYGIDTNGEVYERSKEQSDPVKNRDAFNDEDLDFLVINQSGSTGINLHAGEKMKNQKPRTMIVVQPPLDINTFMQMLGRIHRSGQVVLPEFVLLQTALPAEFRPAAILAVKMAMLNANTTSNAKSDVSEGNTVTDMFNRYGDQIVYAALERDPDLQSQLAPFGSIFKKIIEDDKMISYQEAQEALAGAIPGYIARSITGYLAILPVEEQQIFWDKITADYTSLIDYLNEIGQNELESKALELKAKTVDKQVLTGGTSGDSVFEEPSFIETVETAIGKQPINGARATEIAKEARQTGNDMSAQYYREATQKMEERIQQSKSKAVKWTAEKEQKMRGDMMESRNLIANALRQLGAMGVIKREDGGTGLAVIESVKMDPEKPFAPGSQIFTLQVNDGRRTIKISAAKLKDAFESQFPSASEWDNTTFVGSTRSIVTGNLLAAIAKLKGTGQIISYTTDTGENKMGVLLPASYTRRIEAEKSRTRNLKEIPDFMKAFDDGAKVSTINKAVKLIPVDGGVEIRVPASRSAGGKYWTKPALNALMNNGEFLQISNDMRATFPMSKLKQVIDIIGEPFIGVEKVESQDGDMDDALSAAPLSSPNYTYIKVNELGITKHIVRTMNDKKGKMEDRVFDTYEEAKEEMDQIDEMARRVSKSELEQFNAEMRDALSAAPLKSLRADSPEYLAMSPKERKNYLVNIKGKTSSPTAKELLNNIGKIPDSEGGNLPVSTWKSLEKVGYRPDASEKTQITTTAATYEKIVMAHAKQGMLVLDYAAGRGAGTQAAKKIGAERGFKVIGYEPFSNPETRVIAPEYEGVGSSKRIKNGSVDLIINNAVLNVVPESTGREILSDIYSKLVPGGSAFVNVMGWNNIKARLENPNTKLVGPREVITSRGTFQKGYTFDTMLALISDVLPNAEVKRTAYGDVGYKITKPKARYDDSLSAAALSSRDADYMAAVKAGDTATAQRMVDEAAKAAGYKFQHFRKDGQDPRNTGYVIQFAKDGESSWMGNREWRVSTASLVPLPRWVFEVAQKWAKENLPHRPDLSLDSAAYFVNQMKIVDDAGFWDEPSFVETLRNDPRSSNVAGFISGEGAVVIHPQIANIKSADPVTYDENGEVIPLSQRFNPENDSILYAGNLSDKAISEMDEGAIKEMMAQQEEFGNVVKPPNRASMGDETTRKVVDVFDIDFEQRREKESRDQWVKQGTEKAAKDRKGLVENALMNAYGEVGASPMRPEDIVGTQIVIEQMVQEAGNNYDKLIEAGTIIQAYRQVRGDIARVLASGWDRLMPPEERNRRYLANAILTLPPTIERDISRRGYSPEKTRELIQEELRNRLTSIEKALKEYGVTINEVLGKQVYLSLSKKNIVKDIMAKNTKDEQLAIRMHQQATDVQKIAKATHMTVAEVQKLIDKVYNEALERMKVKARAGATLESLQAAALSDAEVEAEARRMVEIGLGISPTAHTTATRMMKRRKVKVPNKPQQVNWARPEFTSGLLNYSFDTKDLDAIKQTVQSLIDATAAKAKVESITDPDKRAKAEALLKKLETILAKYGTDISSVVESGKPLESYRFDITDRVHVHIVANAIRSVDADWIDKATEYSYFSMLSGLQTLAVNASSILHGAVDATIGRGFEMITNAALRRPENATLGEVKYMVKAMGPILSRAKSNFIAAFGAETPFFEQDILGVPPDLEKVLEGHGMYHRTAISGQKGRFLRIPTRLLLATDEYVKTINAMSEVGAMAYRLCRAAKLVPGTKEFDEKIKDLVNTPGSIAWQLAAKKAYQRTFTNPLPGEKDPTTGKARRVRTAGELVGAMVGELQGSLTKDRDSMAAKLAQTILRLTFVPFVRIPYNITALALTYTPLSLIEIAQLYAVNRKAKDKMAQAEVIERLSRVMIGGTITAMLLGMAEGDDDDLEKPLLVTGSRPYKDTKKGVRETGQRLGVDAYSISWPRKNGTRGVFHYGRIEPLATILATTVDTLKEFKQSNQEKQTAGDAMGAVLNGFANQLSDKTFLKGFGDFMRLAQGETDMSRFVADKIGMLMPNLIKQPLRESDAVFRDKSDSFAEELTYALFPYGQKQAKINIYGEESRKLGSALTRWFDFTDSGLAIVKPIDEMLWRYQQKFPDGKPLPSDASPTFTVNGKQQKMTDVQAAMYRKQAGQIFIARLPRLRLNYENPSDADIKAVQSLVEQSRDIAKKIIIKK